jgi:hypothetical protein
MKYGTSLGLVKKKTKKWFHLREWSDPTKKKKKKLKRKRIKKLKKKKRERKKGDNSRSYLKAEKKMGLLPLWCRLV